MPRQTSPSPSKPSRLLSLRQRFEQFPPAEPENSVPLRILVQLLVTIGILATDFAAADSADALRISFWAVPVSALGATWSWRQRYKRNIPVKFCIAIAMLMALAAGNGSFADLAERITAP